MKSKRRVPLLDAEGKSFKIYLWLSRSIKIFLLFFFVFYFAILREVFATECVIYSTLNSSVSTLAIIQCTVKLVFYSLLPDNGPS